MDTATFARIEQLIREGETFDVWGEDVSVASGSTALAPIEIVRFATTGPFQGVLRAVGQATSNLGWDNLSWMIQVGGRAAQNYEPQQGRQWGFMTKPGAVYAKIGRSKIVRVVAFQSSGSAILASARILGSIWTGPTKKIEL